MYYQFTPSYDELDYIKQHYLSDPNIRVNFFFDVKNGLSGDVSRAGGHTVSLLASDNKGDHLVEFISAIINLHAYIYNRMADITDYKNRIRLFFFCETGKSNYHKNIDILYKANRHLNDYLTRDSHDPLKSEIVFNALEFLEKIINYMPNQFFFFGRFAEYDYIPYVIASRYFNENDRGIIYSTDKDMYQVQSYMPGKFEQLERLTSKAKNVEWHPGRMFVNKDNYIDRILYTTFGGMPDISDDERNFIRDHWGLFRAVVGDTGDNVIGINGIGIKTLLKALPMFKDALLPREEYNRELAKIRFNSFDYKNGNLMFDMSKVNELYSKSKAKYFKTLLSPVSIERIAKNIALMDYDVMLRRRISDSDYIKKVMENNKKFTNNIQAYQFLSNTGIWDRYPEQGVTVNI